MQHFANLLDGLVHTPQRHGKVGLLIDYLKTAGDPDRGWALAALTGELSLRHAKAGAVRGLIEARVDPQLFHMSYDFVGDLAETAALIWPNARHHHDTGEALHLADVINVLAVSGRNAAQQHLAGWLDRLDANGRWALLKLFTGGLRVGVSARLAKIALAEWGKVDVEEIEELWHGLKPPYLPLFRWLEGKAERPNFEGVAMFRPLMLANPIEDRERTSINIDDYAVEWKWDGIRVQIAACGQDVRLYSRSGDDISTAFPDIVGPLADIGTVEGVFDGELLVRTVDSDDDNHGVTIAGFNELQQRLNRKKVSKTMLDRYPAFVRIYDVLFDGKEDVRPLPFTERRARLEGCFAAQGRFADPVMQNIMDLSALIEPSNLDGLDQLRRSCRGDLREGLMLKRKQSTYRAGRPRGDWFKWKRDPLNLDCVLMYAQRGHGKRSSFYSDYTFGAWRSGPAGDEIVPVGKAYSGFTDDELTRLDKWVRNNTTARYGPVREVRPYLVFEVGFDSVHRSTRHKSGVAMRFPRILRIRWDKPFEEADRLTTLEAMIEV